MRRFVLFIALFLGASPAYAQVVNPGPVSLTSTGGSLNFGALSGPALAPPDVFTATGTVDAEGILIFPSGDVSFPDFALPAGEWGDPDGTFTTGVSWDALTVSITPAGHLEGTIDPVTGTTRLRLTANFTLAGTVEGQIIGISIGDFELSCTSSTLFELTTGTTSPLAPASPITGIPYAGATGALELVDNSFGTNGADCTGSPILSDLGDFVADISQFIDSPRGGNEIRIDAVFDPILKGPAPAPPAPNPTLVTPPGPALPAGCTIGGTDGNDVIVGTAGHDVICSGKGNDLVRGGGGNDTLVLGAGNDKGYGGAGKDRILGVAGRDLLVGGRGKDFLNGGKGRDTCLGARDTRRSC